MRSQGEQEPFQLRSLFFSVYLPTLFFSIGQGAVIPVIPLFARELGSSIAAAALIVALRGIGQMLADVPAGLTVSRFGDKWTMVAGTTMIGIVALGASFSPTPLVLGALVLLMGCGWSFWQIARLAYVSEVTPIAQRGRALSMTGGMNRIGNFVGPVAGGFLAEQFGLETAFIAQAVMGVVAAGTMFIVVREGAASPNISGLSIRGRVVDTVVTNRHIFAVAGPPIIALGLLRQARQVFLPLWGSEEVGLGEGQIGLIVGASFFIDAAVFYPVGMLMDTHGRKWALVPCLAVMALGLLVLPLTASFWPFLAAGLVTGIGNGFGSGINMTLGSDFSPDIGRGEFLGVWRLIGDVGQASGPLLIGTLTGIASLGAASVISGGIGLAGAAAVFLFLPETLRRRRESWLRLRQPGATDAPR